MATNRDFRVDLEEEIANVTCEHCDQKIGEVKASPAELEVDRDGRRAKEIECELFKMVDKHLVDCHVAAP